MGRPGSGQERTSRVLGVPDNVCELSGSRSDETSARPRSRAGLVPASCGCAARTSKLSGPPRNGPRARNTWKRFPPCSLMADQTMLDAFPQPSISDFEATGAPTDPGDAWVARWGRRAIILGRHGTIPGRDTIMILGDRLPKPRSLAIRFRSPRQSNRTENRFVLARTVLRKQTDRLVPQMQNEPNGKLGGFQTHPTV
jgi:hypothetical protein